MNGSTSRRMGVPGTISHRAVVIAIASTEAETRYAQRMGPVNDHADERGQHATDDRRRRERTAGRRQPTHPPA